MARIIMEAGCHGGPGCFVNLTQLLGDRQTQCEPLE